MQDVLRIKGLGDTQHRPLDVGLGLPGRLRGGAWVGPHEALAVKGDTEAKATRKKYACYLWEGYITAHEAYGTHTLDARQCRPGLEHKHYVASWPSNTL